MGRLTVRHPVTRITVSLGNDGSPGGDIVTRRADTMAVEEPLELRISGTALAVTMRTPGHDIELAAGFLVSEGIISRGTDFRSAIHCGGPGTGGLTAENTYNVLDISLAPGVALPSPEQARSFYTTSSCGLCGKASIEAVETVSTYDVRVDAAALSAAALTTLPEVLRAQQSIFDKTGGLHAAGLFDAASGELLVAREDVGRHNAVDKVIGWAVLNDRLPLTGTVLVVSSRASFELAQKAVMAGIPILAAVSAPSSLAVEMATASGLTLVGFLRGASMNVYSGAERIVAARAASAAVAG